MVTAHTMPRVICPDCGLGTQSSYLFYIIYFPSTSKEKQRLIQERHNRAKIKKWKITNHIVHIVHIVHNLILLHNMQNRDRDTNYIILTRNCFRSRISFFNLAISRNNSLFSRNIFKLLDLFCCSTWLSWLLRERTVFSR